MFTLKILLAMVYGYYSFSVLLEWLIILSAKKLMSHMPGLVFQKSAYPFIYVVTPCKDGAASIAGLAECLHRQTYPSGRFQWHIVADNCSDNSADVARRLGAAVYERRDSLVKTKGAALNEFLDKYLQRVPFDALVVLDVDSRIGPSFLNQVAAGVEHGTLVMQSTLLRSEAGENGISRIGGMSYAMDRLHQLGRSALKMQSIVQGSGSVLSRAALELLDWQLCSGYRLSDDGELTLRCYDRQIPITYLPHVSAFIGMPSQPSDVRQQRSRWQISAFELWVYLPIMLKRIAKGDWTIIEPVFYMLLSPPMSLGFLVLALWTCLAFGLGWTSWALIATVLWTMQAAYYALALKITGNLHVSRDWLSLLRYMAARLMALLETALLIFKPKSHRRWVPTASASPCGAKDSY